MEYTHAEDYTGLADQVEVDPYSDMGINGSDDQSDVQAKLNWEACRVSLNPSPYTDLTQIASVRYIFIVLYAMVSLMSLTGNFMVIWTVFRNKHMRTVTNYYIVNLATSDFLVTAFVMPLKLLEYTAPCYWHVFSKDALCSFLYYVLPVFVFASVLTLVSISIER